MTIYEDSLNQTTIGEAWQYKRRLECAKEEGKDPYWEKFDISVPKSIVKEISYNDAKRIIERYEWLGCMPVCVKHCFGIFFPQKN